MKTSKSGRIVERFFLRFNASTLQRFDTILGTSFIALFLAVSASAQSYNIYPYVVAGGGGTSAGGQYTLSGTIGEQDASPTMTGGSYSLTGGFWAMVSVVQTAGAPTLYINQSGKTITIYWQNVSGWTLQQNNNPAVPANWTLNSSWNPNANGTNYLNLTSPPGNLFFRLANP